MQSPAYVGIQKGLVEFHLGTVDHIDIGSDPEGKQQPGSDPHYPSAVNKMWFSSSEMSGEPGWSSGHSFYFAR
jgi:hypothetical protein